MPKIVQGSKFDTSELDSEGSQPNLFQSTLRDLKPTTSTFSGNFDFADISFGANDYSKYSFTNFDSNDISASTFKTNFQFPEITPLVSRLRITDQFAASVFGNSET